MIFVGYEEHRIGWRVCDLLGKYSFSNDVIFNESSSGHLGVPRPLADPSASPTSSPSLSCPAHKQPRVRTSLGQAYDDVLRLKAFHCVACDQKRSAVANAGSRGVVGTNGGAVRVVGMNGVH